MEIRNVYTRRHDSFFVLEDADGRCWRWLPDTKQVTPAPHETTTGLIEVAGYSARIIARRLRALRPDLIGGAAG